jgi:hypothetical protein
MSNEENKTGITMTETVKLGIPIQINGVTTDRLVMRRPKLKDIRNASKVAGKDEEEQEIRLFSLLTDCAPSDLEELDYADYGKLQAAFQRMVKS